MTFSDLVVKIKGDITDFGQKMKDASTLANSEANKINDSLGRAAKKSKFEFKDVGRIVQGIMISKAFYGGMNAIKNCTDAVINFSTQLEYAHMAYENMFGDTQLADEFINVLKDFAATTPFDFTESEAAAKRLLAYGIEYKNVMYVMKGIMSASSAQNNPAIIESVSRAMGQIYTKGRLMNEEMRQLAEAGIPAYKILQEKLGLTQKQLQNLGDEAIPASVAINALIDGMNERFSGVVENSTKTLSGAVSNIKDNASILMSGVLDPIYQKVRTVVLAFGDWLSAIRNIYELQGLGGVFEKIIPKEAQTQVKALVANLMNLWTVIKLYLYDALVLCAQAARALLLVFNAFAPVLTLVLDVIGQLINHVLQNATAMRILTGALAAAATMWVIYKAKALSALVVAKVNKILAASFSFLSKAMTFIVAHPFWTTLMVVSALVIGLTGGFNKLSAAIQNLFSKMSALNGVDPSKLFVKENKKRENDISKFNERLDTTADRMTAIGDASEKAAKKAKKAADKLKKSMKDLLSFDEVFKLTKNNLDEDTTGDIDVPDYNPGDIGDIGDVGDIGDISDSLIPELPNFGDYATDFVNKFIGALKDKFLSAGIGAILGGIIGGLIGGPLGAKIGAIAGAIAGWFWDDLCKALGLGDIGKVSVPIGAVLGAAIGKLLGHPVLGAAIGAFAGWLIDSIGQAIETGDISKIWTPLGALIGTAFGWVLGGKHGAIAGGAIGLAIGKFMELFWDEMANDMGLTDVGKLAIPLATVLGGALGYAVGHPLIGAGIGLLVGWLIDSITNGIQNGDWSNVAMPVGIGLGAAIGALVGHPLIGAGIGALVGWVGNKLIEGFQTGNFDWPAISMPIGGGIGAAIGAIAGGGPVGALIGAAIGTLVGWIASKFLEADWSKVSDAFTKPFKIFGESIGELWSSIWDPIKEAFENGDWASLGLNIVLGIIKGIAAGIATIVGTVVTFFQAVWNAFCEIFGIHSPAETMVPIGLNIILGVLEGFKEAFIQLLEWIATAGLELITAIGNWFINIKDNIATWCSDTFTAIGSWVESAGSAIAGWASSAGSTIAGWATTAASTIVGWASSAGSAIAGWVSSTASSIAGWVSSTATNVASWASSTSSRIASWISSTASNFAGWVTNTANSIANWAVRLGNSFATWSTNSLNKITNFVTNALAKFTSFVSTSITKFSQFVSSTVSSISNWASNMSARASSAMSTFIMHVGNGLSNAMARVQNFVSQSLSAIGSWASSFGSRVSSVISSASSAISSFASSVSSRVSSIVSSARSRMSSILPGHATGGVFNKEHVARFAEGNRAEAVIPLQNRTAMQPFVDAVSDGLTQTLAPILANGNSGGSTNNESESLRPLYVGTLIADERGLKELNRKMQIIQIKEDGRRGK